MSVFLTQMRPQFTYPSDEFAKELSRVRHCACLSLLLFFGCSTPEWVTYRELSRSGPRFSPDDLHICFSSPLTGNGDIYVASLDGLKCTRLTFNDDTESCPIYSPKGNCVAFLRYSGEYRHIWIMNSDGTNQRQVTQGNVVDYSISQISDDSEKIYFKRRIRFGPNTVDDVPMVINSDGSSAISFGRQPYNSEWTITSPDGKTTLEQGRIAYDENSLPTSNGDIFIITKATGEKRHLTEGNNPFFSKDSKRIFFYTGVYAWHPLAVINPDGTGKKILDLPPGSKSATTFSKDGKLLALTIQDSKSVGAGRYFAIYIVSVADGSVRILECGCTGGRVP